MRERICDGDMDYDWTAERSPCNVKYHPNLSTPYPCISMYSGVVEKLDQEGILEGNKILPIHLPLQIVVIRKEYL